MTKTRLLCRAALIVCSVVAGCNSRGSLVVVTIEGSPALMGVARVQAVATVGVVTETFDIPVKPAASTPLDFGIDLPPDLAGTIEVHVICSGASGALGSGDGSSPIVPGGRTDVTVTIGGLQIDGGVDLASADLSGADGPVDMAEMGDGFLQTAPPRLISPLSTATTTSKRPLLHWELAAGLTGAQVDLCAGARACATPTATATVDGTGTNATPNADLPTGVIFWRVRASNGVSTLASPWWEFWVGARTASVATSFGTTLDVNGDGYADLAVAAPSVGSGGGVVHIYLGSASGLQPTTASAVINVPGIDGQMSQFGAAVASAGDVNGDGYGDLIVGAPFLTSSTGAAHIFLGSASGLQPLVAGQVQTIASPDGTGSQFGVSVSSAGDVNGDGYADVVVGAQNALGGAGRAHIYLGGPMGVQPTVPSQVVDIDGSDGASARFGIAVASGGDVNGDGYGDVLVGAHFADIGAATMAGRVHIFFGSPTGLHPLVTGDFLNLDGPDGQNSFYGFAVALAGDAKGDGYADILVGAYGTVVAGSSVGRAHLYFGAPGGPVPANGLSWDGADGAGSKFAFAVAGAGDVNGDGYADFLIGAYNGLVSTVRAGRMHTYLGGPTVTVGPIVDSTDGALGEFGLSVSSAGDVNGDGFYDVAAGAPGANSSIGRAHVYLGSASGLQPTTTGQFTSIDSPDGAGGQFGQTVAGAAR